MGNATLPRTLRLCYGLLVLALLLACPPKATAQLSQSDFTFYLSSGLTRPLAPSALARGFDAGLTVGAGTGVQISYAFELNLYAEYGRHGLARGGFEPDGGIGPPLQLSAGEEVTSGAVAITSGRLNLQYLFAPSSIGFPYLTGGIRLQRLSFTQFEVGPVATVQGVTTAPSPARPISLHTESAFGFNLGGGLRIPISYSAAAFLEPTYVVIYSVADRLHFVSLKIGIALGEF